MPVSGIFVVPVAIFACPTDTLSIRLVLLLWLSTSDIEVLLEKKLIVLGYTYNELKIVTNISHIKITYLYSKKNLVFVVI